MRSIHAVSFLLLLTACASTSEDVALGRMLPGSRMLVDETGRPTRSVRVIGDDLVVRVGDASAVVRDMGGATGLTYEMKGEDWTFGDDVHVTDDAVRVGTRSIALEPGSYVVVARDGSRESLESELFHDIGVVHRDVRTSSADAQIWFDRGIALCYGFNHEEAVVAFEKAAELDPGCAMAFWGKAYALSPNYNSPVPDPSAYEGALAALEHARAALPAGSEDDVEHALIEALSKRFALPVPEDRHPLDVAYADAMRAVRERFPDDADVCAMTAEAVMQLRPWGLWSPKGEPAPETPEIRAILEAGLERWPDHPAICHLYIHAMEAGPEVTRSIPAARRLEGLTPGLGHLVHMPSHSYVWTGNYADVVRTNRQAVEIDDEFRDKRGAMNFYTGYRIHNYHFVAYGAMWEGQREVALEYASAIGEQIPDDLMNMAPDLFEIFHATKYHVMVRFGMWNDLIAEPDPGDDKLATRAVWRYARAIAFAASGDVEAAEKEQQAFFAARDAMPETRLLFNNQAIEILRVAAAVLEGEIQYRKGNYDAAFASLREAAALDDELNYDEPWGWMEPARHALGALLTEQGRYEEAIEVYERDLERYPENGWALFGLAKCHEGLGNADRAKEYRERFEKAWERADVEIEASCYCANAG